jgi:hypothetical protein
VLEQRDEHDRTKRGDDHQYRVHPLPTRGEPPDGGEQQAHHPDHDPPRRPPLTRGEHLSTDLTGLVRRGPMSPRRKLVLALVTMFVHGLVDDGPEHHDFGGD